MNQQPGGSLNRFKFSFLGTILFRKGLTISAGDSREIDEEVAKEWEHTLLQNTMDKELHELNRRLEEKEVFIYCVLY